MDCVAVGAWAVAVVCCFLYCDGGDGSVALAQAAAVGVVVVGVGEAAGADVALVLGGVTGRDVDWLACAGGEDECDGL